MEANRELLDALKVVWAGLPKGHEKLILAMATVQPNEDDPILVETIAQFFEEHREAFLDTFVSAVVRVLDGQQDRR